MRNMLLMVPQLNTMVPSIKIDIKELVLIITKAGENPAFISGIKDDRGVCYGLCGL